MANLMCPSLNLISRPLLHQPPPSPRTPLVYLIHVYMLASRGIYIGEDRIKLF